jgi:hypothetical protein
MAPTLITILVIVFRQSIGYSSVHWTQAQIGRNVDAWRNFPLQSGSGIEQQTGIKLGGMKPMKSMIELV